MRLFILRPLFLRPVARLRREDGFLTGMGECGGGSVLTLEFALMHDGAIGAGYFLEECRAEPTIVEPFHDMRTVYLSLASIGGAIELEDEFRPFYFPLDEDMSRSIIREFEVGLRDINGCIHANRFVVGDGVCMVASFGDGESAVESSAEHRGRYLTDATAEFRDGCVVLDHEFREVAVFTIHLTQVFDEGEFLARFDEQSMELFHATGEIMHAVFRRAFEIGRALADETLDTEGCRIARSYIRQDWSYRELYGSIPRIGEFRESGRDVSGTLIDVEGLTIPPEGEEFHAIIFGGEGGVDGRGIDGWSECSEICFDSIRIRFRLEGLYHGTPRFPREGDGTVERLPSGAILRILDLGSMGRERRERCIVADETGESILLHGYGLLGRF